MQIKDVMTKDVVTVLPEETVAVAGRLMARHNIGSLAVCSRDGTLRGMLTDRDIVLRCVAAGEDPSEQTVRQVMTRRVVSVGPGDPAAVASDRMAREQIRRLPVEHDGKIVGMVSLGDLTQQRQFHMEVADTLCDICSTVRKSAMEKE